jgi:hypothetical protein
MVVNTMSHFKYLESIVQSDEEIRYTNPNKVDGLEKIPLM